MEQYGQEIVRGAKVPERPTTRPPTPPVASGAGGEPPEDLAETILARLREEIGDVNGVDRHAALTEWAKATAEHAARNDAELQSLERQGIKVEPIVWVMMRVSMLCTMVFGEPAGENISAARLQYEERVNGEATTMIENIKAQASRARLTQGIHLPPNGAGLPKHHG